MRTWGKEYPDPTDKAKEVTNRAGAAEVEAKAEAEASPTTNPPSIAHKKASPGKWACFFNYHVIRAALFLPEARFS